MMNAHTDDVQLVQLYRQSISAENVKQKLKTDKNNERYSIYKQKEIKEPLFPLNVIIMASEI